MSLKICQTIPQTMLHSQLSTNYGALHVLLTTIHLRCVCRGSQWLWCLSFM